MSAAQKAAAWDVLATLLSPAGIEKTSNVMTLQDVLASQGNMPGQRSSERFSFAVFGTPSETGAWGFRLEGHHLHQSISVRDNRIVSVTPSSFSVNPNRVTSGKHAGLVTLRDEEVLARKLYRRSRSEAAGQGAALGDADEQHPVLCRARARQCAGARRRRPPSWRRRSATRSGSWSRPMPPTISRRRSPRRSARGCATGDREAVHFAWYGPNTAERAFGYRVIGRGFVIELGSVDPAAQHLHTIYHDLGNVLGRTG